MYWQFFLSIALSFTVSFLLTPLTIKFFTTHGWVEDPFLKQQKTGNSTALRPVPRGGGLPLFIGIFFSVLIFIPLNKHLQGIFLASFLTVLVGLWDDLKDISPKLRLLTNIIAALIIVGFGIGIAYISNPFGGIIDLSFIRLNFNLLGPHSLWAISDLLAIIWIVGCMNIVGWSAGVDGQLPGFVAISAVFVGVLGLRYSADSGQWPLIIFAGAIAGSFFGFLPFNFFPQRIMPGYSGKSLAGLLLAVLAILSGAKLATLILLLGIPIVDAAYVLFKRVQQGRFPLTGGPDHLHHQLLNMGFGRRKIALLYLSFSLILGTISLFLNSTQKFYAFIGIVLLFFAFIIRISRHT